METHKAIYWYKKKVTNKQMGFLDQVVVGKYSGSTEETLFILWNLVIDFSKSMHMARALVQEIESSFT